MQTKYPNKLLLTILVLIFCYACGTLQKDYNETDNEPKGGDGAVSDTITKIDNLQKQAEAGDISSQYDLGVMYDNGEGVPQDDKEAVKWYTLAAKQKDDRAQYNLGVMYDNGEGIPQDDKEAVKWYRLSAEQGNTKAQYNLAVMYNNGEGVPRDDKEAIKWYTLAAKQGDADAQHELGLMYAKGKGVSQDNKEAAKWYRLAAKQGDDRARHQLAILCAEGKDDPQDDEEALNCLKLTAEQGDVKDQFYLGWSYVKGIGVPQDDKEAIKWFKLAADQGDASSQFNLCLIYINGVPKDYEQAFKYGRQAAEQGHAGAQFNLGWMYTKGEGVPQDDKEAVKWYRLSAEQGNTKAQNNLAAMYAFGKGTPEDYIAAYKWWNIAASQGDETAQEGREKLKMIMTPDQIAEAQRLSREFRAKSCEAGTEKEDWIPGEKSLKSYGTGFFITSDGYLLTAYHVIKDAGSIEIWKDGEVFPARVARIDAANDIALLKSDKKRVEVLAVMSSRNVRSGQEVFTLGFPNVQLQGTEAKYTQGNISSLSGASNDPRLFQISVAVQPGNSGGPLMDSEGKVVGLVVTTLDGLVTLAETGQIPQNVNYALKSSFLLIFIDSMPKIRGSLLKDNKRVLNRTQIIEKADKAVVMVLCY